MEEELKPCPFCGGTNTEVLNLLEEEPELEEIGYTERNWHVRCNSCYALGGCRRTREEAIETWNRRTP